MTDFQSLIIYAANVDNRALTTAVRSNARSCYNELKSKEAALKEFPKTHRNYATVKQVRDLLRVKFITAVKAMQRELELVKPDKPKAALSEEEFPRAKLSKQAKLRKELTKKGWSEEQIKIATGETAYIPKTEREYPISYAETAVKPAAIVTSTIPPSVAAVDAGYLPAVDPSDVQSATDISGKSIEQISDVFALPPEIFWKGVWMPTEEAKLAGWVPKWGEEVSKTNTIIIAAIVLFFILSR